MHIVSHSIGLLVFRIQYYYAFFAEESQSSSEIYNESVDISLIKPHSMHRISENPCKENVAENRH